MLVAGGSEDFQIAWRHRCRSLGQAARDLDWSSQLAHSVTAAIPSEQQPHGFVGIEAAVVDNLHSRNCVFYCVIHYKEVVPFLVAGVLLWADCNGFEGL